jgi:hypothetical protein
MALNIDLDGTYYQGGSSMGVRLYGAKMACEHLQERYGIKISPATLQKYRCEGGGPKYVPPIAGRIYYEEEALRMWVESLVNNQQSNTSQGMEAA